MYRQISERNAQRVSWQRFLSITRESQYDETNNKGEAKTREGA